MENRGASNAPRAAGESSNALGVLAEAEDLAGVFFWGALCAFDPQCESLFD